MFFSHPLPVGSQAPDFTLYDTDGAAVRLQDFQGQTGVVLVFYPANDTPVCTAQLCEFRDNFARLTAQGIAVLGVNPASGARHRQFAQRHQLPFPLLSDPGSAVAKAYKTSLIPGLVNNRTVYGIDATGKICFAQRGKPPVDEILAAFSTQGQS